MAIGQGYWEIGSNVDLYPTDMTDILIRRVKRQSGIVGSCADCVGEHLKKKAKENKERKGEKRKPVFCNEGKRKGQKPM